MFAPSHTVQFISTAVAIFNFGYFTLIFQFIAHLVNQAIYAYK